MFNLTTPPQQRPDAFTLDKAENLRRRRQHLHRREWRLLLMLPAALAAVLWLWFTLIAPMRVDPRILPDEVAAPRVLTPMPEPTLDGAPEIPEAAALLEVDHQTMSQTRHGFNAPTLAWARAMLRLDRETPPIPTRIPVRSMVLDPALPTGGALALRGQVLDVRDAERGEAGTWTRLLLKADEKQFVQVVAPDLTDDIVLGGQVVVVGRYIGGSQLPAASATAPVALPLLAARTVRPLVEQDEEAELQEYRRQPPRELPAGLFDGVVDGRGVLETRPYYHLIGQAVADRYDREALGATMSLPSFNKVGEEIRRDPESWRGRPMRFRGTVFQAWSDAEIQRDRPFQAAQVQRLLCWSEDYGVWIEELADGATKASIKSIMRLIEFAHVSDQPAPEPGTRIEGVGRFLKIRGVPVEKDDLRDRINKVKRQSDFAYMSVIVGGSLVVVPREAPKGPGEIAWIVGIVILFIIAALAMTLAVRSDLRKQAAFHGKVRRLRETRQRLLSESRKGADAPASPEPPPASQT